MAWQRSGDTGATYPALLDVMTCDSADERSVNEVGGFIWRCSLQSAGHDTDYIISKGTAFLMGGSRAMLLLAQGVEVGLLEAVEVDGKQAWRLIDDPAFIHLRGKAERDWEQQRKRDASNPGLIVPVRLRDGDACRYCGKITVQNGDRRSARAGTYDHREPGKPASVATYVVACGQCNRERSDRADADTTHPLLPAPLNPFYSDTTVAYLARHDVHVTASAPRPGVKPDPAARPAQADPAPVDLAASETTTPPAHEPAAAAASGDLQIRIDPTYPLSGLTGSGRDGPGRAGTGQDGSGQDGSRSVPSGRRRGRRGRGGR